jgi:hypothetical protein
MKWNKFNHLELIAKLKQCVTPAKAWVQDILQILDSRFRGNDNQGVSH